jgi:hypothetical protein
VLLGCNGRGHDVLACNACNGLGFDKVTKFSCFLCGGARFPKCATCRGKGTIARRVLVGEGFGCRTFSGLVTMWLVREEISLFAAGMA